MPIRNLRVVAKVVTYLATTRQSEAVDDLKLDFLCKHLPNRVKVVVVETVDIGGQEQSFRPRQDGDGVLLGRLSEFAQMSPAAMERRLGGWNRGVHDVTDFLERISQNIFQYDGAAFRHGKMHEGPETDRRRLPILNGRRWIDDHVHALVGLKGLLPG